MKKCVIWWIDRQYHENASYENVFGKSAQIEDCTTVANYSKYEIAGVFGCKAFIIQDEEEEFKRMVAFVIENDIHNIVMRETDRLPKNRRLRNPLCDHKTYLDYMYDEPSEEGYISLLNRVNKFDE